MNRQLAIKELHQHFDQLEKDAKNQLNRNIDRQNDFKAMPFVTDGLRRDVESKINYFKNRIDLVNEWRSLFQEIK